jgi:hypothetical protein
MPSAHCDDGARLIQHRRLALALLLSLIIHALLLSLTFDGEGLGLPGFGFPWRARRIEAPGLIVRLVPPQARLAEPAIPSVAQPLQQAWVEQPSARRPHPTPSARPAPPGRTIAPSVRPAAEAKPTRNAPAGADTARALPRAEGPADAALTEIIELPVTDLKPVNEVEAARQAAAQLEAQRQEAARIEAARQEVQRREAARQAAAELEAQRQEAARIEAARQETQRREAARQAPARQQAAGIQAEQDEARREERLRAIGRQLDEEAARQETQRQEAAREEIARQEAARQAPARQQAAGVQAEQDEARREERLRAIGRQLDAEADRRQAASTADRQPNLLPLSLSNGRRVKVFGRTHPNVELIRYAEAWAQRFQFNTAVETIHEVAKRPHRDPLVTVAIRSDGSVESVTFELPSGVVEVDDAIRQIVERQKPYVPFPHALAREYDVVEIRRTWHFDTVIRLY